MPLVKAGHWQTTHFPTDHWQEDHWTEYGIGGPPPEIPTVGAPKKKKHELKLKWLPAIRDYLQWKVSA